MGSTEPLTASKKKKITADVSFSYSCIIFVSLLFYIPVSSLFSSCVFRQNTIRDFLLEKCAIIIIAILT